MPETAAETLTLPVDGMTCDRCVGNVRQALESVPGVQSARVTLEPGQAEVEVRPGLVERGRLAAAIESAGYSVPEGGADGLPPGVVIGPMPASSPPSREGEAPAEAGSPRMARRKYRPPGSRPPSRPKSGTSPSAACTARAAWSVSRTP